MLAERTSREIRPKKRSAALEADGSDHGLGRGVGIVRVDGDGEHGGVVGRLAVDPLEVLDDVALR